VLVFLDVGEDVDFVYRALLQFLVLFEASHLDNLYCVFFVVLLVNSSIDLTICALPYYLVESVVLDNSHHPIVKYY
jgi:hypothetical protein